MESTASGIDPLVLLSLLIDGNSVSREALARAARASAGQPASRLLVELVRDGALSPAQRDDLLRQLPDPSGAVASDLDGDSVPSEHRGRYQTGEKTGRGGQGVVLAALDRSMGREVAFKILSELPEAPDGSDTGGMDTRSVSARFFREARITAQLEHPNIVPVYELGRRDDGTFYYTMRLVRGRTLSAALKECKTLGDRLKLLKPFHDLCNAIGFAHSRGVVHRDIKPANVMVGEFGETVVLDWGVAKVKGEQSDAGTAPSLQLRMMDREEGDRTLSSVGTPSYMSPEQTSAHNDEIDERSDVWALVVMLYELLTGQRPFKGDNPRALMWAVLESDPVPVHQQCPEAPADLAAVALKALSKPREDRYATAKALAEEIGAYMTGGRVQAHEYSSLELFRRFAAKNKVLIAAAGVVLVTIMVALGMTAVSLRRERVSRQAEAQARQQEALARTQEREERLLASFHLSQAFAQQAGRASGEGRLLAARLLAAASLEANPAHPKSPHHDPSFAGRHPEARELRVEAVSRLYRSAFGLRAVLDRRSLASDSLTGLAFSPDGKQVATTGRDGTVTLFEVSQEGQKEISHSQSRANSPDFSPDGALLAWGGMDRQVHLFDLRKGAVRASLTGHGDAVMAVRFSPSGQLLASAGDDGTVRLWNAATLAFESKLVVGGGAVGALAFSLDGRLLATGGEDGTIVLWDVNRRTRVRSIQAHQGSVDTLAFSPDRLRLASGGADRLVRMWDLATGQSRARLEGHRDGHMRVAFSPDGTLLASASFDRTVRLWATDSGRLLDTLASHAEPVRGVAFSPDGKHLATVGYDRALMLWGLEPGRALPTLRGHSGVVYGVEFAPGGKLAATASWDKTARLWNVEEQRELHALAHQGVVEGLSFAPDGTRLATSSRDQTVRMWDVASGRQLAVVGQHLDSVYDVAFSPDGTLLATGGTEGLVRVFDAQGLQLLRVLPGQGHTVNQLAFSRDGKLIGSTSADHTTRLSDPRTGAVVRTLAGHSDWVSGIDFSPDGASLLTSGKEGAVIEWALDSGQQKTQALAHRQWANSVRYSPDGKLFASASDDHTVRVGTVEDLRALLILNADTEVVAIQFTTDGRSVAVGNGSELELYPIDFSLLDADPVAIRRQAERQTGLRLEGFNLEVAR